MQHIFAAAKSFESEVHLTAIGISQTADYEIETLFQVIESLEVLNKVCRVDELFQMTALLNVDQKFFKLLLAYLAVASQLAPGQHLLNLEHAQDYLVHQSLKDGLSKQSARLKVLLPGKVAEFHLET